MRRTLLIGGSLVLLLFAIAAWQLGLFSSDPAEVSLAETVAAVAREEAQLQSSGSQDAARSATDSDGSAEESAGVVTSDDTDGSASACAIDAAFPAPLGQDAPTGLTDLDGTWVVESGEQTFVGYRIDEILSGVDFTAVGRSSGVTGAVTIDSGTLTSAEIVANLSWLTSDSRIRDEQMKSQALQTNRFPAACFELVTPIDLPELPAEGESVDIDVDGVFTIHDVAQPHMLSLEAAVVGDRLVIVGSTTVALADHDIDTPSAPAVAGVGETAIVELSLVLVR